MVRNEGSSSAEVSEAADPCDHLEKFATIDHRLGYALDKVWPFSKIKPGIADGDIQGQGEFGILGYRFMRK